MVQDGLIIMGACMIFHYCVDEVCFIEKSPISTKIVWVIHPLR